MTPHRIALLFNANKVYDRQVIAGIGHYLNSTRVEWDLFMEEDFRSRMRDIHLFRGDAQFVSEMLTIGRHAIEGFLGKNNRQRNDDAARPA